MNSSPHYSSHPLQGFDIPVHRALTEPLLLGGAPRSVAIINGTLAAAIGLGLQQWIAGLVLFVVGHTLAAFAAKRDPDFLAVLLRHLRQKGWLRSSNPSPNNLFPNNP